MRRLGARLLRLVLTAGLGVLVLSLVAAGGLAWRLERRPLDVTRAAQWLLRREVPGTMVQRLSLALTRSGEERDLQMDAAGLARPAEAPGQSGGRIAHALVELGLVPLLAGRLVPHEVVLDGVRGQVRTGSGPGSGSISGGPDLRGLLSSLREARVTDAQVSVNGLSVGHALQVQLASARMTSGPGALREVRVAGADLAADWPGVGSPVRVHVASARLTLVGDTVQAVRVQGAEARLQPAAVGQEVRIAIASAQMERDGEALRGEADAAVMAGGASVPLRVQARRDAGGTAVHVQTAAVPAELAGASPVLASLSALHAPVQLVADLSLGPDLRLRHAVLHAAAGLGSLDLPRADGGTDTLQILALALDAEGDAQAVTVTQARVQVASPSGKAPTTVDLSGDVSRAAGRLLAHIDVRLDQAALTDMAVLWPPGLATDARRWLVKNLTGGTVRDGAFKLTLSGDEATGSMNVTEASGSLAGDDVTIWWLRPVPPVQHAQVRLVWQDADTMVITAENGRQGRLLAKSATMRITGLTGHDQIAELELDLAGPLADALALLKHPRLRLLSKHPVPIHAPAGAMTGRLSMRIPLEADVGVDEIAIAARGVVRDVRLAGVVAGKGIDRGTLSFDVTNDGLTIAGPALIDHMPGRLSVAMDFRAGSPEQVTLRAAVNVRASQRDLAAAGLGALGMTGGTLGAAVDYTERREDRSGVAVRLDLTGAAFDTPLGWAKLAGRPGYAEGRADLRGGRLMRLDGVRAQAPGLDIALRTEVAGGRPSVVRLDRGQIGGTSVTGMLVLPARPGAPYELSLSGPQLDLTNHLEPRKPAAPGGSASLPSFQAMLRFDRVVLGKEGVLTGASLSASGTNGRLDTGHLVIRGPTPTEARMVSAGAERRITADVGDLGSLLRGTGLAADLYGGRLLLNCVYDDRLAKSALVGTVDLRGFTVRGAPAVGKVLQALTIYGIADALRGPGLAFDRLRSQFRLDGSVLEVRDARAFSASLGLTATGMLDFRKQTVALRGTIVPAYFFNTLPGRIPLVGRLFRTAKGTGLVAANYQLAGPLLAPYVSVNPLSVLTPGFTRWVFHLFR